MICPVCGKEVPDNSSYCNSCGASIIDNSIHSDYVSSITPPPVPEHTNDIAVAPKKRFGKNIAIGIVLLLIAGMVVSYVQHGTIYNLINKDSQKYIDMVKGGHPVDQPDDVTYGKAFNNFFSSPKWKYFQATNGKHIVQFDGKCSYLEKTVDMVIQFELNLENNSFQVYAVEMNGIPQNQLFIYALIMKVFEDQ